MDANHPEIEFDTTFSAPPHTRDHLGAMVVLEREIELQGEREAP